MATWTVEIIAEDVSKKLVGITATRTDGNGDKSFTKNGIIAENVTSAMGDELAAEFTAMYDKQVLNDSIAATLESWSGTLENKLNALEV